LEHIAQGYENKEIADELAISKETVKRRAAEILRKWELLRERMAPGESKQKV
jgi:DNA-binding NarL/FixJ family response regulator